MQDCRSTRTKAGLPQFVGEREILAATGMSRATLSRKRDAGDFPQPVQMGKNAWRLDTILVWVEAQERGKRQSLIASAVSNPDDLSLDEVSDASLDLAVRHASNVMGAAVKPQS